MARTDQGKRTSATVVSTIRRLKMLGKSNREVAKIVNVHRNTVLKYTTDDKNNA